MSGRIKLDLSGYEELIETLADKAETAQKAAKKVITSNARILNEKLHNACRESNVPPDIENEITTEIEDDGNGRYTAKVGWKLGQYTPKKPSKGYIAVFMNYGTVKRMTKRGHNRGILVNRGFIQLAKKRARSKIRKNNEELLKSIKKG